MPIEIKVAPPSIVISQGRTFMVTNQRGEIEPPGDEGVYAIDTRFISAYRLYISRQPWELVNYAGKKIRFVLELALRSDFADIFEVKAKRFVQRGRVQSRWDEKEGQLRTTYTDNDFHRTVIYQLMNSDSPRGFANGRIFFEIELEPGQQWHTCGEIILEYGLHVKKPVYRPCIQQNIAMGLAFAQGEMSDFDERQIRWRERSPDLLT